MHINIHTQHYPPHCLHNPLHTAFDPKSIMVSKSCLKEINQLRELYRKDLPLYKLPPAPRTATKRKLSVSTVPDQPKAKKRVKSMSSAGSA